MKPSVNKKCPHCGGNLLVENDGFEDYESCLQCSRRATPYGIVGSLAYTLLEKVYWRKRESKFYENSDNRH